MANRFEGSACSVSLNITPLSDIDRISAEFRKLNLELKSNAVPEIGIICIQSCSTEVMLGVPVSLYIIWRAARAERAHLRTRTQT